MQIAQTHEQSNFSWGGGKVDLVFTDPPYGMRKEKDGVLNDNQNSERLFEFNKKWIEITLTILKDNGSWYCWGRDESLMDIYSFILRPLRRAPKNNRMTFRNLITWDKGSGQGQMSQKHRMYATADEKCLFFMKGQQEYGETKADYWDGWEPLRRYFAEEKRKSGLTNAQMCEIDSTRCTHYWSKSQWEFPNKKGYNKIRDYCIAHDIDAFREEYDQIREEYDQIREEYDQIREEWYNTRAYFDNTHDNMNSVWHFNRITAGSKEYRENEHHPTAKPVALCKRAIKSSSREGEIVLDLFGGSGSTLIACEELGRKCFMMELSSYWCGVIIRRWEKLTKQKALRLQAPFA